MSKLQIEKEAVLSENTRGKPISIFPLDGKYRYYLSRYWDVTKGFVVFVMLNPSTADAEKDDPTIRRCIGFARDWGYGGIEVLNLFAFRSAKPAVLFSQPPSVDVVGPDNKNWLANLITPGFADLSCPIVAAWGNGGEKGDGKMAEWFHTTAQNRNCELYCLGVTGQGQPKHPLYVPAAQRLIPWRKSWN